MIWLSLLAFVVTYTGTWLWIRFAGQRVLQDIPGPRSSHAQPTVRGGGVVFVVVFLLCTYLAALQQWVPAIHSWQFAAIGGMMLIGLVDDIYGLPVISRLVVQITVASLLIYPPLMQSFQSIWLSLFLILTAVWFINLYNFMDGIDGIATLQAISVALVMAVLSYWQHQLQLAQLFGLMAVVMAGFLFWNFPRSRVFMGDAGSGALGTIFVLLMVFVANSSLELFWASVIMMSVFILDASWTLIVRLFTGQKIWTAHKLHAYQILSRRWQSHSKVSGLICGYNLVWLAPITWFYASGSLHLALAFALACAPVLWACFRLRAGLAHTDAI